MTHHSDRHQHLTREIERARRGTAQTGYAHQTPLPVLIEGDAFLRLESKRPYRRKPISLAPIGRPHP